MANPISQLIDVAPMQWETPASEDLIKEAGLGELSGSLEVCDSLSKVIVPKKKDSGFWSASGKKLYEFRRDVDLEYIEPTTEEKIHALILWTKATEKKILALEEAKKPVAERFAKKRAYYDAQLRKILRSNERYDKAIAKERAIISMIRREIDTIKKEAEKAQEKTQVPEQNSGDVGQPISGSGSQ